MSLAPGFMQDALHLIPAGLPLLGYVAFAALVGGLPAPVAPFVLLCLLVLGGLAAGYLHVFAAFHALSAVGGLVLGLWALGAAWRSVARQGWHNAVAVRQTLAILALFALGTAYFTWYFSGTQFSYYDEFFWGAFAKVFHYENGFWTSLSALARSDMTQAYPPVPAVLANLFMPMGGGYSEEGIALGGMLLVLAAACLVYHYMRPHLGVVQALLVAFVCACFIRTLGAKYTTYYLTGYADYLQSALFTGLLVVALFERQWRRALLPLLAGLPVLALCKQTGIVLCLYVMGAVALQHLLLWRTKAKERLPWPAALTTLLGMAVLSFGAWLAWNRYATTHIRPPAGGSLLNIQAVLADPLLWPSLQEFLWAIVERALLISPTLGWMSYSSSTLTLTLGAGLFFFLTHRGLGKSYRAHWAQGALLLAGLLGWLFAHWYANFIFFTLEHLQQAASFERYIGPYMAGAVSVSLMFSFQAWSARPHSKQYRALAQTVLAATFLFVCALLPWQRPAPLSHTPLRAKMENAAAYFMQHTPRGSLFYFIPDVDGDMEEEWCLRYLLTPAHKGTTLVVQGISVPGQARTLHDGFAAPQPETIAHMLQQQAVDYFFIYTQSALDAHAAYFSVRPKAPLLVEGARVLYDAQSSTLRISPKPHP